MDSLYIYRLAYHTVFYPEPVSGFRPRICLRRDNLIAEFNQSEYNVTMTYPDDSSQPSDQDSTSDGSPSWGTNTKLVVGMAILAIATGILFQLRPILTPLMMALILSYLLFPLVEDLSEHTFLSWRASTNLIFILLLVLLVSSLTYALGRGLLGRRSAPMAGAPRRRRPAPGQRMLTPAARRRPWPTAKPRRTPSTARPRTPVRPSAPARNRRTAGSRSNGRRPRSTAATRPTCWGRPRESRKRSRAWPGSRLRSGWSQR